MMNLQIVQQSSNRQYPTRYDRYIVSISQPQSDVCAEMMSRSVPGERLRGAASSASDRTRFLWQGRSVCGKGRTPPPFSQQFGLLCRFQATYDHFLVT